MTKLAIVTGLLTGSLLAACGSAADGEQDLVFVSAAASLTDAFRDIESAFEAANPGIDVALNLGGTSALREQILAGAPADVFAAADRSHMDRLVEAGRVVGVPMLFARNLLAVAVPAGNPAGVESLADFADPDLVIGLCAEPVPCGELGRLVLARAGVTPSIDTNEPDVRALLTKIEAGELDAGLVYATDLAAGHDVEGLSIPAEVNAVVEYPIAVLTGTNEIQNAEAFTGFVLGAVGQQILAAHGFMPP